MPNKQRYQNPVVGDTVTLSLFSYNSNNRANVSSIEKVEVYYLDRDNITEDNPDGRRLVETYTNITSSDTGQYSVSVDLEEAKFVIGNYIDIWYIEFEENEVQATQEKCFEVYPDLWYTSTAPIVYDFNFMFTPNRIRQGAKQYLIIQIRPNVRHAKELEEYYMNLAIAAPLKISIEQECVECMPAEEDLRLEVDEESVEHREKNLGYYLLDTSEDGLDLKKGIYNVWFTMEFGESIYISDKLNLQVY
jgi:hypothetical protein